MADISTLISYDQAFPVQIKNPVDGKDVGITISIVSFDSERVSKAVKVIDSKRFQAQFANEDRKLTPHQVVEFTSEAEREMCIAAIDGWDFGDNTFAHLDAKSPADEKNRRFLIEHPNAGWIKAQILAAGYNLANFSNPSVTEPAKK